MKRFIVTGGGTSGHINPAITIADAIKRFYGPTEGCEIIFTGRKEGLEGELVPKAGYKLYNIDAKPFPMKPSVKLIKAGIAFIKGKKECKKIIKEFKPDAVIGTGGYVCAPLLEAASSMNIPVIIHESNAFPGRANRMMGKKASLVMTGFPNQDDDFPKAGKVVYTGNPIRSIMIGNTYDSAREKLGVERGQKLVFAMGGSLGAKTINDFVFAAASDDELKDVKFVLGTGKQQTDKMDENLEVPGNLETHEYIDNTNDYLAGADVSITRAGAVTCAEVAATGACSVMIPYPHAAHDHQTFNATVLKKAGGCVLISDDEVKEGNLMPVLKRLLSDEPLRLKMRENVSRLAVTDCDDRITKEIDQVLREKASKKNSSEKEYLKGFPYSFKTVLAALFALSLIVFLWSFIFHPSMRIENIIVNGNYELTDSEITEALGISVGDHLLKYTGSARRKLESSTPYIEDVSVRVSFPSTLTVNVTERHKLAYLKTPDGYAAIDEEGRVLEFVTFNDAEVHPVLCGLDVDSVVLGQKTDVVDTLSFRKLILVLGAILDADNGSSSRSEYAFFDSVQEVRIVPSGIIFVTVNLPDGTELQVKLAGIEDIAEDMQRLLYFIKADAFEDLPAGVLDMTDDEEIYRAYDS